MSDVAAVLLAAGASVRMGRNKLLLELGGESVVRRAARRAAEAGMSPVVVVTGHERAAVEAELHGIGCRAVFNGRHATGQHTSVGAGIAAVGEGCAAATVVLADMPFVTAGMLCAVAARYRETGAPLVLSRYGGETIAPPMLYDRSLFGELLQMDRRCGREVARRHRAEAQVVDWPAEALRDLDSREDYERARMAVEGAVAGAARVSAAPDGAVPSRAAMEVASRSSAPAGAAMEGPARG